MGTKKVLVRDEQESDVIAISALIREAFARVSESNGKEHFIVEALREEAALTVSLVAVCANRVVGHVAFSPVAVEGGDGWYGLGPVAVSPDCQNQGVGTQLIHEGLKRLKDCDAQACVVLGEPAFYDRFGFETRSDVILEGVPPSYFQVLKLSETEARGPVRYHDVFWL